MIRSRLVVLVGILLTWMPATASAQAFLGVGLGGAMGGSLDERERTFTVELGGVGRDGWLGAELDFGHIALRPDGRIRTVVGSVLVAPKISDRWRVFGVAGGGKFFDGAVDDPLFAVGGGLLGNIADHLGLRVEARYFTDTRETLASEDHFRYVRIIGGVHVSF